MEKKSKIIISVLAVLIIFVFLLQSFPGSNEKQAHEKNVSWEKAVSILNQGDVREVFQSHAKDVTLVLENGTRIHTVEPELDEIFKQVNMCKKTCENIILATE